MAIIQITAQVPQGKYGRDRDKNLEAVIQLPLWAAKKLIESRELQAKFMAATGVTALQITMLSEAEQGE